MTAPQTSGFYLNGVRGQLIDDQLEPHLAFLVLPQVSLTDSLIVDIIGQNETTSKSWLFLYWPMLPVIAESSLITATPIHQDGDYERLQPQLPDSGMLILKDSTRQTVAAWYVGSLSQELTTLLAGQTLTPSHKIDFIRTYGSLNSEFFNQYHTLHQDLAQQVIGPRPGPLELSQIATTGNDSRLESITYFLEQFPDHECSVYLWNERNWHEDQNWTRLKRAVFEGRARRVLALLVLLDTQNPYWQEAVELLESLEID